VTLGIMTFSLTLLDAEFRHVVMLNVVRLDVVAPEKDHPFKAKDQGPVKKKDFLCRPCGIP
jgi:hypothetical protein